VPFVYTGDDYSGAYAHHVARCAISEAGIFSIPGTPSARGIVLTGVDGVQFTAFYPSPSGLDYETIEAVLRACSLLVVNRHEWQALCERLPAQTIRGSVERIVITDGPRPVELLPDNARVAVPAAPVAAAIDPTGCGDAFVAALTSSLAHGAGLPAAVEAGIRLAGRCLASRGAPSHRIGPHDDPHYRKQ